MRSFAHFDTTPQRGFGHSVDPASARRQFRLATGVLCGFCFALALTLLAH